jgi:hypothetical protein
MKRILLSLCVVLMMFVRVAEGAEKADAVAVVRAVEPYLDDTTLLVAHVDLTRLDLKPVRKTIEDVFARMDLPAGKADQMRAGIGPAFDAAGQWVGAFTKAGGRDVFLVVNASNIPQSPLVGVIPLGAGADAAALTRLVRPLFEGLQEDLTVETRDGALVLAGKTVQERLKDLKPQPRPELAKTFEAAGNAAIKIAFVPSPQTRRVLAEMLPRVPPELVGGVNEPIVRHVTWVGVGISTTPDVALKAVVQSPDAASAGAAARMINGLITAGHQAILGVMGNDPQVAKIKDEVEKLAAALAPKVDGDRLTINLAGGQTLVVTALITPAIAKAQANASQVRSASQMRMILQYCQVYANENKGQFPPDLQTLTRTGEAPPSLLVHPGGGGITYRYLRPAAGSAAPAEQVVIYEQSRHPLDRLNVGFANGHVEMVERARFEKLVAESQARNEQHR